MRSCRLFPFLSQIKSAACGSHVNSPGSKVHRTIFCRGMVHCELDFRYWLDEIGFQPENLKATGCTPSPGPPIELVCSTGRAHSIGTNSARLVLALAKSDLPCRFTI